MAARQCPSGVSARVPDRVDPTVQSAEPPVRESPIDRRLAEPAVDELAPRHDAVLAVGERGDRTCA
jgi:hypothetical protein